MPGPGSRDHTVPAQRVGGRYVVRGEIGRGGMASVHRASDVVLQREVALKVPHAHLATDPTFWDRFRREARAAAGIDHPNVVAIHDWGEDEHSGPFLVLQLVDGPSLREVLRRRGRLDAATTAALLRPAADGLGAAHRAGFVHRDVKPENLLVGRDGTVRVTDFGLARAAASATSTFGDVLVGSPHYLAPEAVRGEPLDPRADVYALGVVLFECLTGRPPHEGDSPYATAVAHTSRAVPAPSELDPEVDPSLDDLVLAATAIARDDRPDDAGWFASELATLLPAHRSVDLAALSDEVGGPPPPPDARPDDTLFLPVEQRTTVVSEPPSPPPPSPAPTTPAPDDGSVLDHEPQMLWPGEHGQVDDAEDDGPADAALPGDLGVPHDDAVDVLDVEPADPDEDDDLTDAHWVAGPGAARRRRRRRRLVGLVVVLALLSASAAGGYLLWDRVLAPVTAIPDVHAAAEADAVAALSEAGFEVLVADGRPFDLEVPAGHVLEHSPTGEARQGSEITLVLSAGPRQVEVPNVVGDPAETALERLGDAGLDPRAVEVHHEEVPEGDVVASDPEAGTVLDEASDVQVVVSAGPAPIEVPDLRGEAADEAQATLQDLGLELAVVERRHDEQAPADTILEQSPAAGEILERDEVVDVVVSDGPPPLEVPGVRGEQAADAVEILEGLGLEVHVEWRGGFGAFLNPGRVFDQDPGPGATRFRGDQVTIYAYEE